MSCDSFDLLPDVELLTFIPIPCTPYHHNVLCAGLEL
jgi:hypothetical protein